MAKSIGEWLEDDALYLVPSVTKLVYIWFINRMNVYGIFLQKPKTLPRKLLVNLAHINIINQP